MHKVKTGYILAPLATEPGHFTGGKDNLHPQNVGTRGPVLDHLVAARVLGDVAPDEGSVTAARVPRVL